VTKNPNVVMCYFGDGATSEGDFHAGRLSGNGSTRVG